MLTRFGAWLTSLGISREDMSLVWTQWISVATMIVTGALNLTTVGEPLGIHISPPVMHWIMVICTASLWFGAKMAASPLFNKDHTAAIVELQTAVKADQQAVKENPPS
jgi:hypothetical protein